MHFLVVDGIVVLFAHIGTIDQQNTVFAKVQRSFCQMFFESGIIFFIVPLKPDLRGGLKQDML